jgi:hypothetical protein
LHLSNKRELAQKRRRGERKKKEGKERGKRRGKKKKKTLNVFSIVASNHGKDPILILIKSRSQSPNLTFPGLKTLSLFSITSNHGKDAPS